jgi:KDO2-lipid IV(A) lauroyltransferase
MDLVGLEHVYRLRDSGKPGLMFGAHIGNWELVAAVGKKLGVPVTTLYRPPSNPFIAAEMERIRSFVEHMVVSRRGAAVQIAAALGRGAHVAIIIDQRVQEGVEIPFFGRPSLSNPLIGILARHFEYPVHGAHCVRLPDGRFRMEMTPPLELPRDADGRIDADAANRVVHDTIEGWIRRQPDQWLWLHGRWKR